MFTIIPAYHSIDAGSNPDAEAGYPDCSSHVSLVHPGKHQD